MLPWSFIVEYLYENDCFHSTQPIDDKSIVYGLFTIVSITLAYVSLPIENETYIHNTFETECQLMAGISLIRIQHIESEREIASLWFKGDSIKLTDFCSECIYEDLYILWQMKHFVNNNSISECWSRLHCLHSVRNF